MVDQSLLKEFIQDCREHLAAMEPDLLSLEQNAAETDQEVVNRLFRTVHSIKGFAVFLGVERFTALSHAMESVLMEVRDGHLPPDDEVVEALLGGVDRLSAMVDELETGKEGDCRPELERLQALELKGHDPNRAQKSMELAEAMNGQTSGGDHLLPPLEIAGGMLEMKAQGDGDLDRVAFPVNRHELEQALSQGFRLYALWVHPQNNLAAKGWSTESFLTNLGSLGRVLSQAPAPKPGSHDHYLLATLVEEKDILSAATELPLEQIVSLEPPAAAAPAPDDPPAPSPPEASATAERESNGLVELRIKAEGELDGLALALKRSEVTKASQGIFTLYGIWIHPERDLAGAGRPVQGLIDDINAVGEVLASDLEAETLETSAWGHLLAGTKLGEPETAALAWDLPVEQIRALPTEVLRRALGKGPAARPVMPPPAPPKEAEPQPAARPRLRPESRPEPAKAAAPPDVPLPKSEPAKPPIPAAQTSDTIRVRVRLVDNLINLAGELVLGRNQLKRVFEDQPASSPAVSRVMQVVDVVTSDLQEHIMQLRMQPVGKLFNKFPRVVRDLARHLNKEVELEVQGGEVELDKSILERLGDPLTHVVRNCVDHGIERPEFRVAAGKPARGKIILKAFHEEGQVNITVQDDGRGIDPDEVAAKAVEAGLVRAEDVGLLGAGEKLNLITLPGLSTAQSVTDISGRGVGMDVVSNNLGKVGGHLQIDSRPGMGTTMRLRLPLTLAIIPSLILGAGGQTFAIPQADVQELVRVRSSEAALRIEKIGEAAVLRLRERLLPLVRLADLLEMPSFFLEPLSGRKKPDRRHRMVDRRERNRPVETESPESRAALEQRAAEADRRRAFAGDINVVVLRVGSSRYGLVVEELFDTEEIVVKSMSRHLKQCRSYSGTTILGDGRVAMILDAGGMADQAQLRFSEIEAEEARYAAEAARRRRETGHRSRSVLVFTCAPTQYFAVPLTAIARLEKVAKDTVEIVGGRECIHYRGSGLPLLRLDGFLPVKGIPSTADDLYLIIPKGESPPAGVVSARIVDIMDTDTKVRDYKGPLRGLAGMAPLNGNLTLFLNLEELIDEFTRKG